MDDEQFAVLDQHHADAGRRHARRRRDRRGHRARHRRDPERHQEGARANGARARSFDRAPTTLRPVRFQRALHEARRRLGAGGVRRTRSVLCTASVEEKVPPFLQGQGQGWVTAEYGMLPRATHTRGDARGGRGQAVGPHAGDPAPDRPQPARRDRPRGAGRAPGHASTATCCRPTAARAAPSITGAMVALADAVRVACARSRLLAADPAARLRRRGLGRHRRRRAAARPRLRRGLRRATPT